jgi:hypothetical protein
MANFYQPIFQRNAPGGVNLITFNNIPQNYTDLVIHISARSATNIGIIAGNITMSFNGDTSNVYGGTWLRSINTGPNTFTNGATATSSMAGAGYITSAGATANSYSPSIITIYNYTSSFYKNLVAKTWPSTNAQSYDSSNYRFCGVWKNNNPITSITMNAANWTTDSVITIYGVLRPGALPKAIGGQVTYDGTYFYHAFRQTGSSTFVPQQDLTADILIVGGGGSGSTGSIFQGVGGGGAGGLIYRSAESLFSANQYTTTVGAGGIAPAAGALEGISGGNSVFGSYIAIGGGGGGGGTGKNGGSGGGGGSQPQEGNGGLGGSGTSGQGFGGGKGFWNGSHGGGGGGAGAVGQNAPGSGVGGNGGAGVSTYSAFGLFTNTGQNISGTAWFAGGGGGGAATTSGTGGNGGGGVGGNSSGNGNNGFPGLANTGGGGGGAMDAGSSGRVGGNGGSGVVIVRYVG